jgi:hypothetical protein
VAQFINRLLPFIVYINLALIVLIVAAGALLIWLWLRMRRLERHYRLLTTGTEGGNLQALLESHITELHAAVCQVQEVDVLARGIQRANRAHIQRLGFLRFNPFRETGGDQSFVLALADQDGNGAVISSLHNRDVTRVYAKPLAGWISSYPLTDEELEGIRKAQRQS